MFRTPDARLRFFSGHIGPADGGVARGPFKRYATVQADDGMRFDPGTVRVEEIREAAGTPACGGQIDGNSWQGALHVYSSICGYGDARDALALEEVRNTRRVSR